MAVGEITSTAVLYDTMALLEIALEAESTGATTAGADITTFTIHPNDVGHGYYLVKVTRAQA